ncbi:PilN domain-containing protein [Cupriavidus sp. AU9028]|uniref:PilN domain-containing protein n=1 Tax=Cupriavidus sp. AU9028 TaxID=2871157 RepID=UPI001C95A244|nr:PilN domain-containing protein [Cupriavidus sp. AU9028]MBY4898338.1 PilN domain-containing protein [Cupriavidus sp. AU9028]
MTDAWWSVAGRAFGRPIWAPNCEAERQAAVWPDLALPSDREPPATREGSDEALVLRYRADLAARRRRVAWRLLLAGAMGTALALAGALLASVALARQLEAAQLRNAPLRERLHGLRQRGGAAAMLQQRIAALEQRESMLRTLRDQAGVLAGQLTSMAQAAPERLTVTRMRQVGETLQVHGVAASQRQVAQWLAALRGLPGQPGLGATLEESHAADERPAGGASTAFTVRIAGLALLPGPHDN